MTTYINSTKIAELSNEIGQENLPVLLDIFLNELNEYQIGLQETDGDLERYLGDISHSLKSSAASFGADALCKTAKGIDAEVKSGRLMSISQNRNMMLESIQATIDAYGALLD